MKKLYLYILILLLSPVSINAQTNQVKVLNTNVTRADGLITIRMEVDVRNLELGRQEMLTVTPILISNDRQYMHEFSPFIITGSVRDKALNRSLDFDRIRLKNEPLFIVRNNRSNQVIPVELSFPEMHWLPNSRLEFYTDLTGCDCENLNRANYVVYNFPAPPNLNVAYIVPPVEEVKRRSETYTARINFEVNRYQILRHYKNNAQVLAEVDEIIKEVKNDPNLTITEFHITGYASPEGNPQSNMTLSKNRAQAFVQYIISTYNVSSSIIRTDWKGEDWEGLRKVVSNLSFGSKQQVLTILDTESNVMTRKRKLQQLSGGEPYRFLLREYYPSLRRNEYTISYVSKNFNVDEARVIIKTKPKYLSQNEMYLVANTYPRDSKDFKETFDIIMKHYPNSDIARLNSAAYELENGSADRAIQTLNRINLPEAFNNLGVAYYKQNDYQQARHYLNQAAQRGSDVARHNLEELNRAGMP